MNSDIILVVAAAAVGFTFIPLVAWIFRSMSVAVEDETTALVTAFGKVKGVLNNPGLNLLPSRLLPWIRVIPVTRKLDFRHYESIHVNDCRGTTIVIDLWVELRICSPEQALYKVESWEQSLQSLLTSSAASILGTQEFSRILSSRGELGKAIREDLKDETTRWGLAVEQIFISKLSLAPDVAQQLFDTVAARFELAKADIEEAGRLKAAMLEAETSVKVAALVAEAKSQYSLAVGRAYHKMAAHPELLRAYSELYELSLIKPHRTIAFHGFDEGELSAVEAAMIMPENTPGASAVPLERENYALSLSNAELLSSSDLQKNR